MTRRDLMDAALTVAALAATAPHAGAAGNPHAPEGKPPKVTERMRKALADIDGKEVTLVTVAYAPGGASQPHTHPGPVFGYVLEGAVVFRLDEQPEKVYREGDVF